MRNRFPAAGGKDSAWAATEDAVRRDVIRAKLQAAHDRMVAREIAAMTMYLLGQADASAESGPQHEIPPLLIGNGRLH